MRFELAWVSREPLPLEVIRETGDRTFIVSGSATDIIGHIGHGKARKLPRFMKGGSRHGDATGLPATLSTAGIRNQA